MVLLSLPGLEKTDKAPKQTTLKRDEKIEITPAEVEKNQVTREWKDMISLWERANKAKASKRS